MDLGVIDPDLPSTFLAGVECDGATYHRSATARDRDRLRQAVLENLGWNILRLWSTDWWTNAPREVERIDAALQSFLEIARQKRIDQAERDAAKAEALLNATVNEREEDPVASAETSQFESVTAQPDPEHSPEEIRHLEPLYAKAPEHIPSDDATSSDVEADPSSFTQDDYLPTLARLVIHTIDQAKVIREDMLIQTMSRAHGFSRVGREIRERVQRAIPSSMGRTEEDVGTFLWSDRQPVVPRLSLTSLTAEKSSDPALVPLPALVDLACRAIAIDCPDEDAIARMRDACGMSRMGQATRARFATALNEARRMKDTHYTPHL
ncbi:hypothetical protein AA101099_0753 [Neoasaia chiangmaiensis NBRC 101099]|uniref:Restriction endonuclease type II-like domain-containing protein n=1 Tax=Neoasaia chiangmaiensis TaxID=320497 RepID=A0A1U9KM77_9PROT|nr:hypothetical protein A0U93_01835 [Neoasaia chiangmaiensis]GBR37506.1 hypothetical protein AA101099_0753 [Neoasaia chiangmaiensis NBRC 101099]GEN14987.1 hypothetical protein NCH01_14180 [Neoasaia chiangmaiensis]